MPSGKLKIRHRDHIISPAFYKQFKEENPDVEVTYKEFVLIIRESNKEIARIVTTEQNGFKLPENHGYLVITSYRSRKKAVDIKNTYEYQKPIYHANLNTLGKKIAIRWFINNNFAYFPRIYKFVSCRKFARAASLKAKEGFNYSEWAARDFIKFDKILRVQSANNKKRYRWDQ